MTEPDPTKPSRVALVLDIETSPTIALTLARARLAEIIVKLHRHGISAIPVRVDIDGYPNPNR